ncbi:MAG TPA: hypothetical protein VGN27_07220 [Gaiellaceae bacterium]|nr:hypothetical protein [Gaiellaceae bacterium]
MSRPRLEELEASGLDAHSSELLVVLAWLVAGDVPVDDASRKAALRRAVLVLAAGGDPHRDVDLDSVAAERLADELDAPERREALATTLAGLDTNGLPTVSAALAWLQKEPDLAWRAYAVALIADELADE